MSPIELRSSKHAIDRLWQRFPVTRELDFVASCDLLRDAFDEAHELNLVFAHPNPEHEGQGIAYLRLYDQEAFAVVASGCHLVTLWEAINDPTSVASFAEDYRRILRLARETHACRDNYKEAA